MQKVIVHLPNSQQRIDLPADQWKAMESWMQNQNVVYRMERPSRASVNTDEETAAVYTIDTNEKLVADYLEVTSNKRDKEPFK